MKSTLPLAALSLVVTAVAASCAKPCNDDTDCTKGVETCVAASDDASGLCVNNNDIDPKSEGEGDVGEGEGDVGEGEGEGDVGEGEGEGEDGVIVVVLSGTDESVDVGVTEGTAIDARVERNGVTDPGCVVESANRTVVGSNFLVVEGSPDLILSSTCAALPRTLAVATVTLLGVDDADDGVVGPGEQKAVIGGAHLGTCVGAGGTAVEDTTARVTATFPSAVVSVICSAEVGITGAELTQALPLTVLIDQWTAPAPTTFAAGTPQRFGLVVDAAATCRVNGVTLEFAAPDAVDLGPFGQSKPVNVECSTDSFVTVARASALLKVLPSLEPFDATGDIGQGARLTWSAPGAKTCRLDGADVPVDLVPNVPTVTVTAPPGAAGSTTSTQLTCSGDGDPAAETVILWWGDANENDVASSAFTSPAVDVIVGKLDASNSSINIEPTSVEVVTGGVTISDSTRANFGVDLSGLRTVHGNFLVERNTNTTAFNLALNALKTVNGALTISSNENLAFALGSLSTVNGALTVSSNQNLGSLTLGSLATVGGALTISSNGNLGSVTLGSLSTVSGPLTVSSNARLTQVDLSGLTTVGTTTTGHFTLDDNASLATVGLTLTVALPVPKPIVAGQVRIRGNSRLSDAQAQAIADRLESNGQSVGLNVP